MLVPVYSLMILLLIREANSAYPGNQQSGGNGNNYNNNDYNNGNNNNNGYNNGGQTSGSLKYLGQSCSSKEMCSSGACMDGRCCYHEGTNCGVQNKLAANPCCPDLACYEGNCVPRFVVSSTRSGIQGDTSYKI